MCQLAWGACKIDLFILDEKTCISNHICGERAREENRIITTIKNTSEYKNQSSRSWKISIKRIEGMNRIGRGRRSRRHSTGLIDIDCNQFWQPFECRIVSSTKIDRCQNAFLNSQSLFRRLDGSTLTANFCVSGLEFFWANVQRLTANLRHFGCCKSPWAIIRLKNSKASDACRLGF